MNAIERVCRECGGRIRPLAKPGRLHPYRPFASLELPAELAIPTCDTCGEEWIDEVLAEAIDAALKATAGRRLREAAVEAIRRLEADAELSVSRVEAALGISAGYLSRLCSEKRTPSSQLVAELALLARDPGARLRELEELWR